MLTKPPCGIAENYEVLQLTNWENTRKEKMDILIASMVSMTMKRREKGSISLAQKHNSFQGHWFGRSLDATVVDKQVDGCIRQGAVIKINTHPQDHFVVYSVYCDNGKKWFLSTNDDKPCWPLEKAEILCYQLVVLV